jgi:hypothetical protein
VNSAHSKAAKNKEQCFYGEKKKKEERRYWSSSKGENKDIGKAVYKDDFHRVL